MLIIHYFLIALAVLIFIIVFFFAWSSLKGAPWAPTNKEKAIKMLELAKVQPNDLVYDLGCGDGRILIIAATQFGARAIGYEIDPIRYLWCKSRIHRLRLQDKVQVKFGNFFHKDLSDANIVICYLLQKTNNLLQDKLLTELKNDSRIISNNFTFSKLELFDKNDEMKVYAYKIFKSNHDS
ncbi:MAG: SAM-dependent methyltransferase [Asgard group archaeon]|nr:SAM-dependent methyltransferase [Asgard group archaeon]